MTRPLRLLFALPLLCCALAATAIAHGVVHDRDTAVHKDRMDWRQDGLNLRLQGTPAGLRVEAANCFGLKAGDVITTVAGKPMPSVQSLMDTLRSQQGHSLVLQVRSADGQPRTLRWSASDYADLVPPEPPAPPLPPPPPPAPRP